MKLSSEFPISKYPQKCFFLENSTSIGSYHSLPRPLPNKSQPFISFVLVGARKTMPYSVFAHSFVVTSLFDQWVKCEHTMKQTINVCKTLREREHEPFSSIFLKREFTPTGTRASLSIIFSRSYSELAKKSELKIASSFFMTSSSIICYASARLVFSNSHI